jgi:serine/threonine protein kinase/Tol biopolymer transport system component
MSLSPGTRLGPYEVLSAIGAGGMGEVYKARDTRLERLVALKVIQQSVASSAEMRERFEREARAISSLDHPHICILYDVCREADVSFLVMQYLEGETLADRLARAGKPASDPSRPTSMIGGSGGAAGSDPVLSTMSRGPIPFDTTLRYAAEIAQALDAAHRRGIVHRDLKPGNVMLTKSGTKLLDFGLAKLAADDKGIGAFGDATRTSPSPLTSQGALLGTLHYMSPEQLEGRDVDSRSDIHAFGALLFEMLSGRRVYEGQSQAAIIAAIIGNDPPALPALADTRTTVPVVAHRALDRLLAKCLAKDPDDRWQSAADLAAELRWIGEERIRAVPEQTAAVAQAGPAAPASRLRERLWMGIAAAAIVALAGLAYVWYPRPAPPPPQVAFSLEAPDGHLLATGPGLLSVSPDGQRIAFVTDTGTNALWIRTLGSLDVKRLERADGAWHLAWSPDGKSIVFAGSGGPGPLRKVDTSSGLVSTLAPQATGRATWSRDGVILYENQSKLYRVTESAGTPEEVMAPDAKLGEVALNWPYFLPDGHRYLVLARNSDPTKSAVLLASLDSKERTVLLTAHSSVEYAGGYLFYQNDGTLVARRFDADTGKLIGDTIQIQENIRYNAANGRSAFSVSASGSLAFVTGENTTGTAGRRIMLFDRLGKSGRQIGPRGTYAVATLSPNGRLSVVGEDNPATPNIRSLSLMDMDRGVLTRFTTGSDDERNAVWAPDSQSVVFQSRRGATWGIYRRSAGGGATGAELVFSSPENVSPTGFSKDGTLLLMTKGIAADQRVWVLPLTGDKKAVQAFPGLTIPNLGGVFSPDGKWIAYIQSPGPNTAEVYIRPYPADDRLIRVSPSTGRSPYWAPDGKSIVYRADDDSLQSVALKPDGRSLAASPPVKLFTQPRISRTSWYFSVDASLEKFLLVLPNEQKAGEAEPTVPITVMLNVVQNIR